MWSLQMSFIITVYVLFILVPNAYFYWTCYSAYLYLITKSPPSKMSSSHPCHPQDGGILFYNSYK